MTWAALALGVAGRAAELTAEERAGKMVYFQGESPSGGEISATIGLDAILPGSAVTCASCHGDDGLGRPEGGVIPTEVTWSRLTRPYGHSHRGGTWHPAFTERTVALAITDGVDPSGHPLDTSMPRYSMSRRDMASLIAYLRRIESDRDPSVSEELVRIGTALPTRGRLGELGEAARRVLAGYFGELNARGGIHGRRVELVVAEYGGDRATGLEKLRRTMAKKPLFALVAGFLPGDEEALFALAEEEKLPVVGPLTQVTSPGDMANEWVFFVQAGLREQARALVARATGLGLGSARAAIVHPSERGEAGAAGAALAEFEARGWKRVEAVRYERGGFDAALAGELSRRQVEVVMFLGNDAELATFTRQAHALKWTPTLLLSGVLTARSALAAPVTFQRRLLVAFPSAPADATPLATEELFRLAGTGGGSGNRHRAAQVSAYVAAKVLTEGLRRSGRQLSREKLVRSLEGLYAFETGLTPPLTYGPSRRVGALGAHVVTVDLHDRRFVPSGGWVALPR